MKFKKFGKTLLMIAISAGVIVGVTSCVQSFTVGYLYVTGTNTASSSVGYIEGFKIDHNKGALTPINGLSIPSGGANPGRSVLLTGSRFIYVLNRGANSTDGSANCSATNVCNGANIALFSIGGNGVLTQQPITYSSQGNNPVRIFADTAGAFLYVLDQIAPNSTSCALALGAGVTSCGDITAFKIDPTTGRLSLVVNAQVTSANGQPLPYFPVPANPIDFVLASNFILTLSGTPATGDSVFPYTYSAASGQLTVNQNSAQPLNIAQGTSIVTANGSVWVLDAETLTNTVSNAPQTAPSWIFQYNVGANGSLQASAAGSVPGPASLATPVYLIAESKGKWIYAAYAGDNNTTSGNSESGIAGYVIDPSNKALDNGEVSGSPFGSGSGPQCILEDPSNQFIYTANFNDSTVTGSAIDQNSGALDTLPGSANKNYALPGPAAWCIATGRTS